MAWWLVPLILHSGVWVEDCCGFETSLGLEQDLHSQIKTKDQNKKQIIVCWCVINNKELKGGGSVEEKKEEIKGYKANLYLLYNIC